MDNYPVHYPELWRDSSPSKTHSPSDAMVRLDASGRSDMMTRSPLTEYGYNAFPVPPIEMEPLSAVFSFTSGYKDYPAFKDEKTGPDSHIADALLSLKHAVVHPGQMSSTLGPLSPNQAPHLGGASSGAPPAFSYSISGGNQSGCSLGSGTQYPPQYDPPSPGQGGGSQYPQHPGIFPAMSVNVSMSMNVGMTPNVGMPQNYGLPEQWGGPYPHQNPSISQYTSPHAMSSQGHSQYPPYSPGPSQGPYQASYTFSSELRSPTFHSPKDVFYRNSSDPYKPNVPRFYSLNSLSMRRGKASLSRANSADSSKINLCRICGKTYARPSTLKTHLRTHSGEKPYRCSTCTKSFSQAANLTAHLRTHTGDKPFRCPVCERRFSQSSSVTTHMRTHSGERPYRCRMCKKAFSDSSTLTKHLRIHSGEKPYQCKLCLLRFSQSGNLNRHMRVHSNSP